MASIVNKTVPYIWKLLSKKGDLQSSYYEKKISVTTYSGRCLDLSQWPFCSICKLWLIVLFTLNYYNVVCQLYLNKNNNQEKKSWLFQLLPDHIHFSKFMNFYGTVSLKKHNLAADRLYLMKPIFRKFLQDEANGTKYSYY